MIYRNKIDMAFIAGRTGSQKSCVDWWRKMSQLVSEDPEKDKRYKESLCVVCFYNKSRIGGARCTSQQCAFCDTILHSGNTCVDVICESCASKYGLCKHCGSDIDLKQRRKRNLPVPTANKDEVYE